MKDYERLYRACKILDSYIEGEGKNYNLHPDHDVVYLCFNVQLEELSEEHKKELEELRCHVNEELESWMMFISC